MAFILLTTCLIIFLYFYIKLKNFIILFLLITFSGLILLTNNNYVKHRYKSFNIDVVNYKDSGHGRIFSSSTQIWQKNKYFGVGLKNFRYVCDEKKFDTFTQKKFLCSTHPHNLSQEILSETGLIGFVIFFSFIIIFLKFSLNHLNKVNLNIKPYLIGSISLILVYLWPLKSSGSIFSKLKRQNTQILLK